MSALDLPAFDLPQKATSRPLSVGAWLNVAALVWNTVCWNGMLVMNRLVDLLLRLDFAIIAHLFSALRCGQGSGHETEIVEQV